MSVATAETSNQRLALERADTRPRNITSPAAQGASSPGITTHAAGTSGCAQQSRLSTGANEATAAPLSIDLSPFDQILRKTKAVALGRYRCTTDQPGFRAGGGPHRCAYVVFRRTSVRLHIGVGPTEVVTPNHVSFHNPGESYSRTAISAEGEDCDWIALSPAFAREILRRGGRNSNPLPDWRLFAQPIATMRPHLFIAQRQLFAAVRLQPGAWNSQQVDNAVAKLVACLVADAATAPSQRWRKRRHPRPTCHQRQVQMIEEAKAILGRDFSADISLVELARQLHCSPANLSRIFHAATGLRLNDYRLELRLRKGVALLEESGFSIGDIGVQVGFASHSHFTSAFHQHFGMNPSQFLRARPERLEALIPQPQVIERRDVSSYLSGAAA